MKKEQLVAAVAGAWTMTGHSQKQFDSDLANQIVANLEEIMPRPPLIQQVAIHVPNMDQYIEWLTKFGMTGWIRDDVEAMGSVFGAPIQNKAQLAFNYSSGFEFELIHYPRSARVNNWHAACGRDMSIPFMSHMSLHVQDMEDAKSWYQQSFPIAQELFTTSHTNPELRKLGRTYHYVVFDSRNRLGFDIKLIKRIAGHNE